MSDFLSPRKRSSGGRPKRYGSLVGAMEGDNVNDEAAKDAEGDI
jgi:hypothetical protein